MDEALEWLTRRPGLADCRRLAGTYVAHNENGVRLRVTVWDLGTNAGPLRYMAEALSDHGRTVTGDAQPTVERALEKVNCSSFLA